MRPRARIWTQAVAYWQTLPRDEGAHYDKIVVLNAAEIAPQVTWGTNPEAVLPITGAVPDPRLSRTRPARADERCCEYMGLTPGQKLAGIEIDVVFIGSCTNAASRICAPPPPSRKGRNVAPHVRALVVPGSGLVKKQAEEEGLDQIFLDAGFEWREPGCSMCLAHEPRQARARRALRQHLQPQFRRPARAGRAHASALARHGRRGRGYRRADRRPGAV